MIYRIQKISIDLTAADLLISKMARAVRKEEPTDLDKRYKELWFPSDDGLIDVYLRIQFNSDYHRVDGCVQCVGRGVIAAVKMCSSAEGYEIAYDCPISIEDEINKMFWI